jgi:transcriptional regulator with XRE-family HTH domain
VSNDICERFGIRLKKLRTDRGWSQIYMAEKLGIDRSYLSELESGKIEPCLRNLELIADGFEITVDKLLTGIARK